MGPRERPLSWAWAAVNYETGKQLSRSPRDASTTADLRAKIHASNNSQVWQYPAVPFRLAGRSQVANFEGI